MIGWGGRWDESKEVETSFYLDHHYSKCPVEVDPDDDINVLELWPVLASLDRWGYLWRDQKITIWTNNTNFKRNIANICKAQGSTRCEAGMKTTQLKLNPQTLPKTPTRTSFHELKSTPY